MRTKYFTSISVFLVVLLPGQRVYSITNDSLADRYFSLAEGFKKNAKADSAIAYYEKASVEFSNSKRVENVVSCYNQIGVILTRQDHYEKARTWLNKALQTGLSSLDSNNLVMGTTYISLGVVYAAEENYEQSLRYHYKALAIRSVKLGENHADVATSYGNIGNVYLRSKNYDRSVEAHIKAMQIREKLYGKSGAEVTQSYFHLGTAYKEKGEYKLSLEHFEKALKNKIEQPGSDHKDLAKIYKAMSDVCYLAGNKEQGDLYKTKAETIVNK